MTDSTPLPDGSQPPDEMNQIDTFDAPDVDKHPDDDFDPQAWLTTPETD